MAPTAAWGEAAVVGAASQAAPALAAQSFMAAVHLAVAVPVVHLPGGRGGGVLLRAPLLPPGALGLV
jgi:hypothetical protein